VPRDHGNCLAKLRAGQGREGKAALLPAIAILPVFAPIVHFGGARRQGSPTIFLKAKNIRRRIAAKIAAKRLFRCCGAVSRCR
jgi:hypothetical protein